MINNVYICSLINICVHDYHYLFSGDAGGMEADMNSAERPELLSTEEYAAIARSYAQTVYIPVSLTIDEPAADPASIYRTIAPVRGYLLESMEGVPKRAVRSIIGINPVATLCLSEGSHACGENADIFLDIQSKVQSDIKPLEMLREICKKISVHEPSDGAFSGGMTGYCRYDLISSITDGMVHAEADDGPVMKFMVAGDMLVFDHVKHTCTIIAGTFVRPGEDPGPLNDRAVSRVQQLKEQVATISPGDAVPCQKTETPVLPDADRKGYEKAVSDALEYIRAGEIFQVVLSRRFSLPYTSDPFRIYEMLREINPSPYLYYLNFGDETVVGSSPEMLVKTEGRKVTTVPIAGTRPRGRDEREDEELAQDLRSDPKECAEHLMLVDLARNDIGRVSEFGTVEVTGYMEVEKFSHVQHLTSVVTGDLKSDCSPVDALEACFPAGTVSGAPKIRAMQIIGELEQVPRGLYSGAVGYLGFDGLMEFAIAIRTVIVKDGMAYIQAGAGIVADSVPEREFLETQAKAQAMVKAVCAAGAVE